MLPFQIDNFLVSFLGLGGLRGWTLGECQSWKQPEKQQKTFHDTESLVVFGVNVRLEKAFAVSCKGMSFCNRSFTSLSAQKAHLGSAACWKSVLRLIAA
ncbi:hypothetical protein [Comamonas sp. UBA7528]|uniref:hypothetical protein n=1 Tax=Comamonas sp. UBA7528 TaxID=1946391 RepID=UPI001B4A37F1|nr:hypothetical protein [Comamonas sp. UBA7528]MBP7352765.1 hypothetical protein [Comamonas sp.]